MAFGSEGDEQLSPIEPKELYITIMIQLVSEHAK